MTTKTYRDAVRADPVRRAAHAAKHKAYVQRPEVKARQNALRRERDGGGTSPDTPEKWARSRIRHLKTTHRATGIPVTIGWEDVVPTPCCPVLGMPFTYGAGLSSSSPSVDKINPALGYVPGNVRVIAWLANRLKSDCTDPAVFRAIANYIEGR